MAAGVSPEKTKWSRWACDKIRRVQQKMGSKAAGWSRPSTCGSNKLDSISQAREIIFPFTNRFRKKRVKAEEDYGVKKRPNIVRNRQKVWKEIYLSKVFHKVGI